MKTTDGVSPWQSEGYPVVVPLPDGEQLIIDLPEPSLLAQMDMSAVGVVVTDGYGRVKRVWGLARGLERFAIGANLSDSELGPMIEQAANGEAGHVFLDGYRYYSSSIRSGRTRDVMLLVCDATEEHQARLSSTQNARNAELFRRIGRALTMHQSLNEMAVLTVHEIASAYGLASVLLWARSQDDERLTLRAHVGANRQGAKLLNSLEPETGMSCAAELVAVKKQAFWVPNVSENLLTKQLEARFCYLAPKSVGVLPLMVGDRLMGIIEFVSRDGDRDFLNQKDLFETLAEHVSLALNTALMFEQAEKMASYDALTGIANHRALQDFLHARLSESERNGTEVSVLMLDVDHFRAFNEEEGHDAGDAVLKMVAQKLRESVRPYDLPARYGGEEFSAVLPGLNLSFAMEVAERLRRNIEKIEYVGANGRLRHVSASIGVASYPETAQDPASLLKAADVALFKAKRAGRNRVMAYEGPYRDETKGSDLDDRSWLERWQTPDEKPVSERLFAALEPYVTHIATELMLSPAQRTILENLIRVYPTYKRLMALNDPDIMRQLELAAEFRPLLPSLLMMGERFDGMGPMQVKSQKIPLLARILNVLVVIAEHGGRPFIEDPTRFDPELVSIVSEVADAA